MYCQGGRLGKIGKMVRSRGQIIYSICYSLLTISRSLIIASTAYDEFGRSMNLAQNVESQSPIIHR